MPIRCAIYTRKSTDDGLEQEFNSLHAQREACEACIKSQRGMGWTALAVAYDDGGLSGGTLDRPALQQLLAGIQARKVDTVVVYKVDRLTRSLADFAKIVEVFDAHEVSFVSVTQQFNTTTSMGRLTLNMLLSFAQFEREVTGERISDKIAASKRKGMWMGGPIPLGYDSRDKKLVVNGSEAEVVRKVFSLYLELGGARLPCARNRRGTHERKAGGRTDGGEDATDLHDRERTQERARRADQRSSGTSGFTMGQCDNKGTAVPVLRVRIDGEDSRGTPRRPRCSLRPEPGPGHRARHSPRRFRSDPASLAPPIG